eukprot:gnl/Chilomastix_cuspidata/9185.p1 GENE.gnl/Chilomastix_cuspidata/9185~~gnl/Chilomastix_cuspidata/9185.p1  ORF type:complete len:537 (+),score=-19.69 gnl/Chilomastix_cuspidata/9185:38-1612(+)
MTIKKLGLSAIAATVLASSAFAGTLTIGSGTNGKLVISTEYVESAVKATPIKANIGGFVYQPTIAGSGTVSDPTVNMAFSGDLSSQFSSLIGGGTFLAEKVSGDTGTTVAVLKSVSYDATTDKTTISFDGIDGINISNGKEYYVATDPAVANVGDALTGPSNTTVFDEFGHVITNNITDETIDLTLYSTSGTEEVRDTAASGYEVKDQFKIKCITQFDGMINFENNSSSFVATGHGIDASIVNVNADDTTVASVSGVDGISDVNADSLIFQVENGVENTIDLGLDGNGSVLSIYGGNALNGVLTSAAATELSGNVTEITSTGTLPTFAVADLDADLSNLDDGFTLTFGAVIPQGTTKYAVTLSTDHTVTLPAVTWEGNAAMADTALTSANAVVPAIDYTANHAVGSWQDYTYIGQVAGATSDANVDTKFFIANRSCDNAVAPTFRLIKDGVVTSYTATTTVAKDSQVVYNLSDILSDASLDAGKYAVEIVLPGLAEDFYVYAQSKNKNLGQFKDLPVYNTSGRE